MRSLINRFRSSRKGRRGSNAVEFALTAPVLFTLILGTMDFGWMFCHQLLLDHVTSDAARIASMAIADGDVAAATANGDSAWEGYAQARWDEYGLPGDPTFTTTLQTTGSVVMVHVTGEVDYGSFVASYGLPDSLSATSARRLENQIDDTTITNP